MFNALRGLGLEAGSISLVTVPVAAGWFVLALALGRMHEKRTAAINAPAANPFLK